VEVDEPPAAEEADVWTMWRAAFEGNTTKLKELIRAGGGVNEENPVRGASLQTPASL